MDVRIGALAFVGLLVAALAVALVPASVLGIDCGWWWAADDSTAARAICDGTLDGRRNWSIVLLVGAFVVPRAITFLAGHGRERQPF